jgi:hypothetical protein
LQNAQLKESLRSIFGSPFDLGTFIALIATAVVTGVSAAIIFLQLRLDHERSRRDTAVKLIREWTVNQRIETSAVIQLVKKFTLEQCETLVDNKNILIPNIDITAQDILNCLLPGFPDILEKDIAQENKLVISGRYAAYIRFRTVSYLNMLESILSAWNCGIARRDIIEEQFRFLKTAPGVDLPKCRQAFCNLRGNTDVFPSITNYLSATQPRISKPLRLVDSLLGGD